MFEFANANASQTSIDGTHLHIWLEVSLTSIQLSPYIQLLINHPSVSLYALSIRSREQSEPEF